MSASIVKLFSVAVGGVLALAATTQVGFAASSSTAPGSASSSSARGTNVTGVIGAGLVVGPLWRGGGKFGLAPVPVIHLKWGERVFLNGARGFGVNVYASPELRAGAAVNYRGGRDELDGARLRGMGTIASTARFAGFVDYLPMPELTASLDLTRDVDDAGGMRMVGGLGYRKPIGERTTIRFGAQATFADGDAQRQFYGVTAAQSARSGNARYKPTGGAQSLDFSAGGDYAVTENWVAVGTLGVTALMGDAADSPLVERKTALTGMFGAAYKF